MRALIGAATLAALCVTGPFVQAQDRLPAAIAAKDSIHDCKTLGELIALVGERTKKVFLFNERVQGVKVHLEGRRDVANAELYDVFQSILELNGLALATIARGTPAEVVKVVDARNMRRYAATSFNAEDLRSGKAQLPVAEEMVTVTYKLGATRARSVANALRPLLDPNRGGQIIGIDGAEVLVLSDYAPNVRRLMGVIELMDHPSPETGSNWPRW
jgi:type II secretory pathway component GspD/PulD (secretin)